MYGVQCQPLISVLVITNGENVVGAENYGWLFADHWNPRLDTKVRTA